ncbi:Transcriptional regulator, LysR family [Vulgatibacter incomptus]|uniref:Transcriptional regulator, LysR family n=1 Tax=Vulgatibacter incomptus TaxID=1391653 RepID=A0A0K1PF03_9BACT|nr:Transcriptional regulator, LysR family [Vulgatibacter incomptus]
MLRLNIPRVACHVALPEALAEFGRRHPAVRTEVVVDNNPIDIVRAGFDAGVRTRDSVHQDMVRVRLSPPLRLVVVGSPRYFAHRGRPSHPQELVDHDCLGWRSFSGSGQSRWTFVEDGQELEVGVSGPVLANDAALLISCAEKDLGLALVAEPEARREVAQGSLETVLDDYSIELPGLFLYFPRNARDMPKLRAFVDCATALLGPASPPGS